jgi:hypothetical protein
MHDHTLVATRLKKRSPKHVGVPGAKYQDALVFAEALHRQSLDTHIADVLLLY